MFLLLTLSVLMAQTRNVDGVITAANGLICSGNGNMEGTICDCFEGFFGSSCENRACPVGPAWSDIANGDDSAHNLAECSNMGHCDYLVGSCVCLPGFEGEACERTSCPGDCFGHGACMSMERRAALPDVGLDYTTVWDAKRMYGCKCDEGYAGYDCSDRRVCPTGDDPMTTGQTNEIQYFRCDVEDTDSKKTYFHICWKGECTVPVYWNDDVSTVQEKINALSSVTDSDKTDALRGVDVTFETNGVGTVCAGYVGGADVNWLVYPPQIVKVEFRKDFGDLDPIEFVYPRGQTAAQTPTIELACVTDSPYKGHLCSGGGALVNHAGAIYLPVKGTKEEIPCSGRGICEGAPGECICDANFASSNGEGGPGNRGDCGYQLPTAQVFDCIGDFPCNLRGVCSGAPSYTCTCMSGFEGADCSEIICPLGKAWFDYPSQSNKAHRVAPCSNRGLCDYTTGECTCQTGFTGAACDVLDCPTSEETFGTGVSCSGHGNCLFMHELAELANQNGVPVQATYGAFPNDPLTWDFDMIKGCQCNDGWFGIDCNKRSCPRGDNPDTAGVDEIQRVSCEATIWRDVSYNAGDAQRCVTVESDATWRFTIASATSSHDNLDDALTACLSDAACEGIQLQDGTYTTHPSATEAHTPTVGTSALQKWRATSCAVSLSFRGQETSSTTLVTDVTTARLADVETWIESMTSVTDVSVSLADNSKPLCPYVVGETNSLIVAFNREHGDLPELVVGPSELYGVSFDVTTDQEGTKEDEECSGKGFCDHTTGVCTCIQGFISSDGYGNRGTIQNCGHRSPFALALESAGGGGEGGDAA